MFLTKLMAVRAERSPTSAMTDLYDYAADDLAAYAEAFRAEPGQVGAVFAIGEHIIGMELFDSDQTLAHFLERMVRSYALDALEQPDVEFTPPDRAAAQRFLAQLAETPQQVYAALGEGEDVRLMSPDVNGGALVARERVVHLTAFNRAAWPEQPLWRPRRSMS